MIGYIKGKVLSFGEGSVLIENNGIGYEVQCSSSVYGQLVTDGEGEVYTYMAVKEDGISLYGFVSPEEKKMFLSLISVSGVGPKMGITVLSGMSLKELVVKIASADIKGLSTVKGLGKKTAERIVLELREKLGAADKETGEIILAADKPVSDEKTDEAVAALMGLGFTRAESEKAVKAARADGDKPLEQLIAFALKHVK